MSDMAAEAAKQELVQEYALDAPPEKVWRAVSIPAFRERWLPDGALADAAPLASVEGEEVSYRMQDDAPPFLESVVTFQIIPGQDGGTLLRIIHGLSDARLPRALPPAANDAGPYLMLA